MGGGGISVPGGPEGLVFVDRQGVAARVRQPVVGEDVVGAVKSKGSGVSIAAVNVGGSVEKCRMGRVFGMRECRGGRWTALEAVLLVFESVMKECSPKEGGDEDGEKVGGGGCQKRELPGPGGWHISAFWYGFELSGFLEERGKFVLHSFGIDGFSWVSLCWWFPLEYRAKCSRSLER